MQSIRRGQVAQVLSDRSQHAVHRLHHVMRRNTQRPNALAEQSPIAVGVTSRSIIDTVRVAVDLDV
jgi:UDP-N-acetylglucosamine 2-epimerase